MKSRVGLALAWDGHMGSVTGRRTLSELFSDLQQCGKG